MVELIKLKSDDMPKLPRHAKLRYDEARKKFMSAERVRMFSKDPHFSRKIRGNDTES